MQQQQQPQQQQQLCTSCAPAAAAVHQQQQHHSSSSNSTTTTQQQQQQAYNRSSNNGKLTRGGNNSKLCSTQQQPAQAAKLIIFWMAALCRIRHCQSGRAQFECIFQQADMHRPNLTGKQAHFQGNVESWQHFFENLPRRRPPMVGAGGAKKARFNGVYMTAMHRDPPQSRICMVQNACPLPVAGWPPRQAGTRAHHFFGKKTWVAAGRGPAPAHGCRPEACSGTWATSVAGRRPAPALGWSSSMLRHICSGPGQILLTTLPWIRS